MKPLQETSPVAHDIAIRIRPMHYGSWSSSGSSKISWPNDKVDLCALSVSGVLTTLDFSPSLCAF